jgi:hypothetical protein
MSGHWSKYYKKAKKLGRVYRREKRRKIVPDSKYNPASGWLNSILFVFVVYVLFKAFIGD